MADVCIFISLQRKRRQSKTTCRIVGGAREKTRAYNQVALYEEIVRKA